jgi:hypothetical protein
VPRTHEQTGANGACRYLDSVGVFYLDVNIGGSVCHFVLFYLFEKSVAPI